MMLNGKKLITAKSFANAEIIKEYEKNGKMYGTIKEKCDRCNGRGEYWWGAMINSKPQFSGTCYKCNGARYLIKTVRLYTKSEFENMEKANEKAREKRRAEQEEKMKREFAHRRQIWLETNGFDENENTYIVVGNSYPIKDQLKEAGFRYNGILRRWMKGEPTGVPQDYKGDIIKIAADQIVEYSAWGEGHFILDAKAIVDAEEKKVLPPVESNYVGQVGKRSTFTVTLERVGGFEGRFGFTFIYNFKDEDGNVLVWFSSVDIHKQEGDTFSLVGTVKNHEEYNNIPQTILTRCKVKKD